MLFQHHSEQSIHQPSAATIAGYGHIRDDTHVALTDDLHELHHGVTLRPERFNAGPVGFSLRVAGGADGLSLAEGAQARGFGFTGGLIWALA